MRLARHAATGGSEATLAPRRRLRAPSGRLVLAASAVVAAALAAIPLIYLVVRVAQAERSEVVEALWSPRIATLMVNTVGLVLAVSAACLVLGVAIAWLLVRTDLSGRRIWLVVTSLSLAVPSYVAAFGWIATTEVRGFWGAFIVLTLCNVPLVTLPTIAALRLANSASEDVARTLGRTRWQAFIEATWPQIRPAALAGVLLVALYVLSDFGSVALMRYQAFTWAIQVAYESLFDRTLAAVMSLVLAAMGIALVVAERRLRGARARVGSTVAARTAPVPVALGRWAWVAHGGLAVMTALSLGVPLGALAKYLVLRTDTSTAVRAEDLLADAVSTVGLAAAGAAVALALALPIGILAARYRSRLATVTESASYLGLALPGIVVGLSLVFFSLNAAPMLYQSIWMLAFAYGVLFLPKAVGAVRSSIGQVEPGLEDAARTMGLSPARVWTRVTARIAWPGIGAGVLLVALTAMKELPATLLLRPTGTETLATSLWRLTSGTAYAAAAPYALVLILVAAVPALLLTREVAGGRRRPEETL
ncbi:ABC transporter permease [Demequina muriae]|uniref:Iron ABC transporter permease n=1 Tax=Demequina muriae TaxID=3051664 RepID=A0ABT8GH52_9MICO|nr:iron ABC transporter permease [Demequina sp. EGI L300058]MDN4480591.1 iron ABC transporter permease [Demequina sp. EGI L300058]